MRKNKIRDLTRGLAPYIWMHRDAILTEAQIKAFTDWAEPL